MVCDVQRSQRARHPLMAAKADQETVFAWMDKTGNGYRVAAAHFGLNVDTVKSWCRRRTLAHPAPPARTPPHPAQIAVVKNSHGHPIKPPPPPMESFTPEARDCLRSTFRTIQRYGAIAARAIADYERVEAERTTQRSLGVPDDCLPELPPLIDPRAILAAQRALKVTLEIAPGLASFDATTDANAGADRGAFNSREDLIRALSELPDDVLRALVDDRATG